MPEIMARLDDLRRYCEKRHCGSVPIEYIKQMPTIEPEARHGRWIYVGEETMHDGWTYRKYKCSECGFLTVETINYCQNCGRDMRETDTNVGGK